MSVRPPRLILIGMCVSLVSVLPQVAAQASTVSAGRMLTSADIPTAAEVDVPLTQETRPSAVSPDGRTAYVVTWGLRGQPGYVQFIDVGKATLVRSVAVGPAPTGPAITPDGRIIATGSWDDKAVTFVDTRTGKVLRKVAVAGQPDTLFIGPKGKSLFAFLIDKGVVAKIDLTTYRVTGVFSTKVGHGSCRNDWTGMAMTKDSKTLLLGCSENGLLFLSTSSGRLVGYDGGAAGDQPYFGPNQKLVYTGVSTTFSVTDARTRKPVASTEMWQKGDGDIDGIESPMSIAVMPDGSKVYATMPEVGQISILDPRTGKQTTRIAVNGHTTSIAQDLTLSRDGSRLYATESAGGVLTIDTATDTVIAEEPGPNPSAAPDSTTGSNGILLLADSRIGQAWNTYPAQGDLTAAGFRILTMPQH